MGGFLKNSFCRRNGFIFSTDMLTAAGFSRIHHFASHYHVQQMENFWHHSSAGSFRVDFWRSLDGLWNHWFWSNTVHEVSPHVEFRDPCSGMPYLDDHFHPSGIQSCRGLAAWFKVHKRWAEWRGWKSEGCCHGRISFYFRRSLFHGGCFLVCCNDYCSIL